MSSGPFFILMASDKIANEAIRKLNGMAMYGRGVVGHEAQSLK